MRILASTSVPIRTASTTCANAKFSGVWDEINRINREFFLDICKEHFHKKGFSSLKTYIYNIHVLLDFLLTFKRNLTGTIFLHNASQQGYFDDYHPG
jgi:hypothetical protein